MTSTDKWTNQKQKKQIIESFLFPKTPGQVQRELSIKKFSLQPFLKRRLLHCLCPQNSKGRLYVSTNKARKILGQPEIKEGFMSDMELNGWIMASPRQRYVIVTTMAQCGGKRTSEEIRIKASRQNPCLSRISTKSILKELNGKGLVETEMGNDRRRYYWLSDNGQSIVEHLKRINGQDR